MNPSERAAAIAAQARIRERADRARNREQMPLTAAFVDAFRDVFGKLPSGTFTENGHTIRWGKYR
jgi:hypothetical protein